MKLLIVLTFTLISNVAVASSWSNNGLFTGYKEIPTTQVNDDHTNHPDLESEHFGKLAFVPANPEELKSEFWIQNGKDFVEEQLKKSKNTNRAKNVIFFLGDGMSMVKNLFLIDIKSWWKRSQSWWKCIQQVTIAATRVLMGDENEKLAFEKFPYTAMSKTYCVDKQVADSACTATAYLTGVKG